MAFLTVRGCFRFSKLHKMRLWIPPRIFWSATSLAYEKSVPMAGLPQWPAREYLDTATAAGPSHNSITPLGYVWTQTGIFMLPMPATTAFAKSPPTPPESVSPMIGNERFLGTSASILVRTQITTG